MKVRFVKIIASFDSNAKRATYEWNELPQRPMKSIKVKSMRIIATIDNKTNNNQPYLITIYHDEYVIRPNTSIIISCKSRKIGA